MRLDIRYRVHFRYGEAVSESQNEVRMRPRDDEHQNVLSYRLRSSPPVQVLHSVDYWGTAVDHLGVRLPHTELELVAEASVDTSPRPSPTVAPGLETLRHNGFRWEFFEFLEPSEHVVWEPGDAVVQRAEAAARQAASVPALVSVVADRVRADLAYRPGSTEIGVTLEELAEGGAGVCQDFAHLAIGMLRSVGVPARYVSGYLFAADETVRADGAATADGVSTGGAARAGGVSTGGAARAGGVSTGGAARAGGVSTGGAAVTDGTVRAGGAAGAGGVSTGGAAVADETVSTGGAAVADETVSTGGAAGLPDPSVPPEPSEVRVQTHAWVEAAIPGWGWQAIDPTNGGAAGERHVVIGCGRDYGDVAPVRGAFLGSTTAEVEAEVVIGRRAGVDEGAVASAKRFTAPQITVHGQAARRPGHQQQQQQQQ